MGSGLGPEAAGGAAAMARAWLLCAMARAVSFSAATWAQHTHTYVTHKQAEYQGTRLPPHPTPALPPPRLPALCMLLPTRWPQAASSRVPLLLPRPGAGALPTCASKAAICSCPSISWNGQGCARPRLHTPYDSPLTRASWEGRCSSCLQGQGQEQVWEAWQELQSLPCRQISPSRQVVLQVGANMQYPGVKDSKWGAG